VDAHLVLMIGVALLVKLQVQQEFRQKIADVLIDIMMMVLMLSVKLVFTLVITVHQRQLVLHALTQQIELLLLLANAMIISTIILVLVLHAPTHV